MAHDHNRQSYGWRQHPHSHVDPLGPERGTNGQGANRVADGYVTIHTHYGQGENTCEHVVIVNGHHSFAQSQTEGPETKDDIRALERKSRQHKCISQGQVKDVNVGGRFHLCVPEAGTNITVQIALINTFYFIQFI